MTFDELLTKESNITTSNPLSNNNNAICEPINPEPPVKRTLIIVYGYTLEENVIPLQLKIEKDFQINYNCTLASNSNLFELDAIFFIIILLRYF